MKTVLGATRGVTGHSEEGKPENSDQIRSRGAQRVVFSVKRVQLQTNQLKFRVTGAPGQAG